MIYVYIGIAIIGAILGGLFTHLLDEAKYSHLESRYQALQTADFKAAAIEQAAVSKAQAAAGERVKEESTTYETDSHAPVTGAPVIRLCPVARGSGQVLPAAPAASGSRPAPDVRADDLRPTTTGWDSSPVVQVGKGADAQVNGLLDYIRDNCTLH